MRIVYLNKVKIEENLPAVNFTLFNSYALSQAGAECFLFVQSSLKDYQLHTLYQNFLLEALENFHIKIIPKKKYLGLKTNQWFYLTSYNEISRLHKKVGIDAVISRDPGALPYLSRLKSKHSIPAFYQPHNFYLDLKIRPDINPKNARKYHLLEKKFIPRMNGVFCLQDSQAKWYKEYLTEQNIIVAKPGLIKINETNNQRYGNRLIGYIGSLQLKKGANILLEAFQLLKNKDFKLLMIGGRNQNEIQPVQQRIQELKLNDRVKITGWVPFSQVETYLQDISVGMLPLQDIFYNRYLTAPNKLFDYLSQGIPIIASDLPAIRDFITENVEGMFFKPESPKDLTRRIETLFSDENDYERYRENASKTARKYLWKIRAEEMIKDMQQIISA